MTCEEIRAPCRVGLHHGLAQTATSMSGPIGTDSTSLEILSTKFIAFKPASAALPSGVALRRHFPLGDLMSDYLELGPCPYDENCEQLGKGYDPAQARLECRVLRDQLIRQFGPPPVAPRPPSVNYAS